MLLISCSSFSAISKSPELSFYTAYGGLEGGEFHRASYPPSPAGCTAIAGRLFSCTGGGLVAAPLKEKVWKFSRKTLMFLGKVTESWVFIRESEQESNTEKGFLEGIYCGVREW